MKRQRQNGNENNCSDKILTIPNVLSFIRLGLIPVIIWAYCVEQSPALTASLVVISGVTDVVDGFIARHFNMISNFGKGLDPVADKLTQIAILFCLVTRFPMILLPLIVIIIKEVVSGILRWVLIHKSHVVDGAVWHGKANTVILYTVMFIHIVWYNIEPWLSNLFILISTGMMILSFVLYSVYHVTQLRVISKKNKENKENKEKI